MCQNLLHVKLLFHKQKPAQHNVSLELPYKICFQIRVPEYTASSYVDLHMLIAY